MKATVKLFTSIWDMLMDLQMFDLPFTFGQFLVALCFLDVAFIVIRHALQNSGDGESTKNESGLKE